jgi:hypothetical protein
MDPQRSASMTDDAKSPHSRDPQPVSETGRKECPPDDDISPTDLRYWLEFGCWTTLALAPFLYYINGPAVSEDQFVVRTALVVLAACGAVGLRT